MSAQDELHVANKPYLLTLTGLVTLHYLDDQTISGEIVAQDSLNFFLKVDNAPLIIPRSQIRYIKGQPGQAIVEADTAIEMPVPPIAEPQPSPPTPAPEPEPVAQFVEEELIAPVEDDLGGTMVIPPLNELVLEPAQVEEPVFVEPEELGQTMVIPAEPVTLPTAVTETKESTGLAGIGTGADTLEATFVVNPADMDEDNTFVLDKVDMSVSAHLVCTTGPHAGEVVKLHHGIVTIGRSSDNTFPLSKDKEVSRRHAIITYEASKFVIQDQNSLNGTHVNNENVKEPYPLEDGDIIVIGISTLKFQEK